MNYPYKWAEEKFLETLKQPPTEVFEATTVPLTNIKNIKEVLELVPHNSAVWQHTARYHTAMIYIEKGKGRNFNRTILDLIASGVDTQLKFKKAWKEKNGGLVEGTFPKVKSSATGAIRAQQKSLITVDKSYEPNPDSKIPGFIEDAQVHRTHLISAQTTGIENHEGLLIDFDGWLNSNPLNEFETAVLDYTKEHDIIWICQIWPDDEGIHWRYRMYDKNWKRLVEKEWVDDRWRYNWGL